MPHLSALSELESRVGELNRTIQEMQIKAGLDKLALEELKLSYSQTLAHIALLQLRIDAMQKQIEQITYDTVDSEFKKKIVTVLLLRMAIVSLLTTLTIL